MVKKFFHLAFMYVVPNGVTYCPFREFKHIGVIVKVLDGPWWDIKPLEHDGLVGRLFREISFCCILDILSLLKHGRFSKENPFALQWDCGVSTSDEACEGCLRS